MHQTAFSMRISYWSSDVFSSDLVGPLVNAYFPPRAVVEAAEFPRADWRGPADDDELIRRMLASRVSADAAFGGKISVQRLWAGDCDKSHGPEFALISHLLFWTGCDEERTARLLLRCEGWKARRAKWAEPRAGKSHLAYTR